MGYKEDGLIGEMMNQILRGERTIDPSFDKKRGEEHSKQIRSEKQA